MKPIALAGVVLIVLGVAALVYQGITYTTRETVIDIGPIHATADRQKRVSLPPVVGIAAVAGGVALLFAGGRMPTRKRRAQWNVSCKGSAWNVGSRREKACCIPSP